MAKAGTVWVDVRGDTKGFMGDVADGAQKASRSLGGIVGNGVTTVMGDIGRSAGVAAIGLAGVGVAAVKTSMDFNAAMSGVSAVAGASAAEMETLREAALAAGAATSFSASEAAAAQGELVKAGVSVADVLGGALAGSLGLAAAGQLELKDAAEISAQAMNIFGLAGEDVTHIADVLAAGANKSAADVKQLGDALRQGGLVASQLGIGLEDTIGTLSLFADNALIGSDAGTSFKTMLQRFNPASKEAAGEMAKLGLSFYDAEGNFVGLEEAAQRLQDAMSGLTQEQRNASMNQIFGADAIRAANLLYEAGAAGIREYTDAVDDQGAAQRMAAEQLNNLKGDLEEFSGATETALIRIGDLLDGVLRGAVQSASGLVNVFNDFAATPAWGAVQDNIARLGSEGSESIDGLADKFTGFLEGISAAEVDRVFARIEGGFKRFSGAAEGLGPVLAGVGISLGTMTLGALPFFGALVPQISILSGVLGGLVLGSEKGRKALSDLGGELADLANTVGVDLLRSFSRLAGEWSGNLASVITDVGDAATYAAEVLGPVLAGAIDSVGPPIGDLIEAGGELVGNVLPLMADLAGGVLPIAFDVLGASLGVAADAAGLLADNAWLLVPALVAFGAVKFGDQISKIGSAVSDAVGQITSFKSAIDGIAATRGVSSLEALGGVARSSGGDVKGLAGSLAGALNPAVLGVTAAITVGAAVWQNWAEDQNRVKQETEALTEALVAQGRDALPTLAAAFREILESRKGFADAFDATGLSVGAVTGIINEHVGQVDEVRRVWQDAGENIDVFRTGIDQLPAGVRPLIENLVAMRDAGAITTDQFNDVVNAMVDLDKQAQGTAGSIAFNAEQLEKLIPPAERSAEVIRDLATAQDTTAGLDAQQQALGRLAGQFPELAAAAGLAVGEVADANAELANETARAVGELRRLADEFAELSGAPRDVDEASRRAKDAVQSMMETFAGANFDGFNYANIGIDENTEAGRRNADAIQRAVEAAERLAEAQALTDTTGKASTETLQGMADQLGRLRDAGILTEEEYQKLLDIYSLTPEAIATTVVADTANAKTDLDDLKAQLLELPGVTEPERALIEAAPDAAALANVERSLNLVARSRQVLITPKYEAGAFKGLPTFGIPQERAAGGPVWPGEPFIVGEQGPELGFFPANGGMVDAQTTARILTGQPADTKVQSGAQFTSAEMDRLIAAISRLESVAGTRVDVTANTADGRRIGLDVADELWMRGN